MCLAGRPQGGGGAEPRRRNYYRGHTHVLPLPHPVLIEPCEKASFAQKNPCVLLQGIVIVMVFFMVVFGLWVWMFLNGADCPYLHLGFPGM